MSVKKAEVLRGPLEPVEDKKTYRCVFVALVIQHAKRMHPIILSYVACRNIQYYSTLFHKRQYFSKNGIENKMCFVIFSTTFV